MRISKAVYAYNPNAQGSQAGGLPQVQDWPRVHNKILSHQNGKEKNLQAHNP